MGFCFSCSRTKLSAGQFFISKVYQQVGNPPFDPVSRQYFPGAVQKFHYPIHQSWRCQALDPRRIGSLPKSHAYCPQSNIDVRR